MGLDPSSGLSRVGHIVEVLVSQSDYELDIGAGKGPENIRVGIVELDPTYLDGLKKGCNPGWGG